MSLKEVGLNKAIDCHTHSGGTDYFNLHRGGEPKTQSVDDLLLKARQLAGVDRVVTFPLPSSSYYDIRELATRNQKRPSGTQDFPYQLENTALIVKCKTVDNVFPFMCIDPSTLTREQIDALQTLYEKEKFFGLKLHTAATHSKATDLAPAGFVDFALEKNIPIMIHSGLRNEHDHPHHIIELAKDYPRLRICVAHLACLDEETIGLIPSLENVFIDTSPFMQICDRVRNGNRGMYSPNHINPDDPVNSMRLYYLMLKNDLIWGTDEPWTNSESYRGSYAEEAEIIAKLCELSPDTMVDITTTNSERFLFG